MNGSTSKYNIIGQRDRTRWNEDTHSAEDGIEVMVRAETLPNTFVVFVPRSRYSPENTDILVRHELAIREGVANLGG